MTDIQLKQLKDGCLQIRSGLNIGCDFAGGGAINSFFSIMLIELFKDICTIEKSNWSLLIGI